MSKGQVLSVVAAALAAVLLVVLAVTKLEPRAASPAPAGAPAAAGGGSGTRASAPAAAVPSAGAADVPANVAVPTTVVQGNPAAATLRVFDIKVQGGAFTPNTVVVNAGDTVHMSFTAVDRDYDFTQPDFGLRVALPEGKATAVELNASAAGKFTFYCKSCGGPAQGPVGYIVAVGKQ